MIPLLPKANRFFEIISRRGFGGVLPEMQVKRWEDFQPNVVAWKIRNLTVSQTSVWKKKAWVRRSRGQMRALTSYHDGPLSTLGA